MSAPELMEKVDDAIRTHVLGSLPNAAALISMPIRALLAEYGTWRSRLVSAEPRRAHVSRELAASSKAARLKAELDTLVADIEAGADLRRYLSGRVWRGPAPASSERPLSAREDRDLMLADWGIHHLHLTGPDLLFVAFMPANAYLIDICRHGDWARRSVLETVIRNWPDAGVVLKTGAIGMTTNWGDRDRKQLREAGISGSMIEVDGAVWIASSIGLTMDGTPMRVAQAVMGLTWALADWRDQVDERLQEAEQAVDRTMGREVRSAWDPAIHEGQVGLVRDGCFHAIGKLP